MPSVAQKTRVERLNPLLACPQCHAPATVEAEAVRCAGCGALYPVADGVPIMLPPEQRQRVSGWLQKAATGEMFTRYRGQQEKAGRWSRLASLVDTTYHLPVRRRLEWLLRQRGPDTVALEVGSGRRRLHASVINLDIDLFPEVDVVGMAEALPFRNDRFDVVFLLAVIEHLPEPERAVAEVRRVLRPQGYVYAEAPFMLRYHAYPDDFRRFSRSGLKQLFAAFQEVDTGVAVGPTSGLLGILSHYATLFNFSSRPWVSTLLKAAVAVPTWPLKFLDRLLVKNPHAHELAMGLYFLGQKESS